MSLKIFARSDEVFGKFYCTINGKGTEAKPGILTAGGILVRSSNVLTTTLEQIRR